MSQFNYKKKKSQNKKTRRMSNACFSTKKKKLKMMETDNIKCWKLTMAK